jgi:hypothetical protein
MKRFLVLCLFVLLVLGVAVPAFAQVAPTELGALARWVPDKAPVYIAFRTDDDYLATLDALGQRLNAAIPDADIPPILESLDQVIADAGVFGGDADFQSAVRSWLGATASAAIVSLDDAVIENDEDPPALISMEVTNRAAAEEFWGVLETEENYTRSTEGDFTVFSPPARSSEDAPTVAVREDVAFIATLPSLLPSAEPSSSLANSERFSSTLSLLPADGYNIVAYLNLGDVLQVIMNDAQMSDADMAMIPGSLMSILGNYPPMAFGATTLDARSFAIDFALSLEGLSDAFAEMGISMEPNAPLNPDFVERIPAGTPLVAQGADLRMVYNQALQAIRLQVEMLGNMDDTGGMTPEQMEAELERALEQVTFFVQGATGLDLETDLIPALTEDYALYLGFNPALADATSAMSLLASNPVNFGLLLAVNDPSVISTLVENLTDTIQALPIDDNTNISIDADTIGGNTVNVITITSSRDLPFPMEIVIGGDEEVFFIGTPDYARAALSPDGGLPSDAQYQEATSHTLADARSLLYLASGGLQPLVNVIEQAGNPGSEDAQNFAAFLSLLSSATITSAYEEGVSYGRAVWTFPE